MAAKVLRVQLDQSRVLFYRTQDVVDAERRMGKPIRQAAVDLSISDLVTLLWAGLRHQQERLTTEQVSKWIDTARQAEGASVFDLWNTVAEALVESGILPRVDTSGVPVPEDLDPTRAPGPGTSQPSMNG